MTKVAKIIIQWDFLNPSKCVLLMLTGTAMQGSELLAMALQELGPLLCRQQQQLQKEWLMLLSHIQCTDRFYDKAQVCGGVGEKKGSRGAQPIMHMWMHCTDTHTLMGARIFLLDGANIANGRTTLINWGVVGQ